jgi:hypothetical protein
MMAQDQEHTSFGLTATQYGIASLVLVCLTCATWQLVVASFIVVYIAVGLALLSVLSGAVGIVKGLHARNMTAAVIGGLGVVLAGSLIVWAMWSLNHF